MVPIFRARRRDGKGRKTAIVPTVFLGVLLGGAWTPVCAQGEDVARPSLQFRHLSVKDGLSHPDVRAIVQDHQGFMWFGTWLGGLNRYDGYAFKVYRHEPGNPRSLSSDGVRLLYVDHTGVLWAATTGPGLDRYDRDSDSFEHYRHRPGDPGSLPHDYVRALYEDEAGTLWVGTQRGLSRFDRGGNTFVTYRADPNDPASFGEARIQSIGQDRTSGLLWVGIAMGKGVRVVDRPTGRFTEFRDGPEDPAHVDRNTVVQVVQDRAGILWLCTRGGLTRFDPTTRALARYVRDPSRANSLTDDYLQAAHEDRAGRFWVATNNGLNLMDRGRGTFTRYFSEPDNPDSLADNVINTGALYEDAAGAVWIGTRSAGVDRVSAETGRFTTYRREPRDHNSLGGRAVTSLFEGASGDLWIATESGLDRFDGRSFTHHDYPHEYGGLSAVAVDAHGVVWTGSYGGGLSRFDGRGFTHFRHDPRNPDSLANDFVQGIVPDAKGGLWIGPHGAGLDYFDGRRFRHFPPNPADPAGLPDAFAVPALLDRRGMLWVGTASMGLVRLETSTGRFTTYLPEPAQPGDQSANWTEDVCADGDMLWVASQLSGLWRFDPAAGVFTHHYTEQDGLASNSVMAVTTDAQGRLWASTAKGLSRFDPKTGTFRNYDVLDGLQGNTFLRARARAADGRLYFGGPRGLNAFYPDRLVDNPTPPPVVLTAFELFNKPVPIATDGSPLRQSIAVARHIVLRHDQSVFRLQFAALDYTAPQKNRFAFMLEGFDRDWQHIDATRPFATYTNLDPGEYVFRVKAANNDGVWNDRGAMLAITITPPWWSTWWFRGLAAAILLGSLCGGYALHISRLHERRRKLESVVATRTTELRAMNEELEAFAYSVSHDLRAPLRHIEGYLELVERGIGAALNPQVRHYMDAVADSSRRMGMLIDDLLSFSRMGRREMSQALVDLNDLVRQVVEELSGEASGRAIEWHIADLPPVTGDRAMLRIVLVNLLSNAVKFTRQRDTAEIAVGALKDTGGETVIFVRDNGAGFDQAYAGKLFMVFQRLHLKEEFDGTGIGLANVRRIVARHGGRCWAEGKLGEGATFYFSLPRAARGA